MTEETKSNTKERAEYWAVSTRTIQAMRAKGVPVDSDAGMVDWYVSLSSAAQVKLGDEFVRRIHEVRSKMERDGVAPGGTDTEAEEFGKNYKPELADEKGSLADIKRERAFYLFRLQRARNRKDRAGEAESLKHFARLSDLLHDAELRAQRLGRDLGESFSAADVGRLGRAVAYWLMNSADTTISQIASGILAAAATGPMDREAVRRVVEPVILAERMLAPMARAAAVNAPIALPSKFVAAMREGAASCLEDGATEFDRLYSQPVPEPGAGSPAVAENAPTEQTP